MGRGSKRGNPGFQCDKIAEILGGMGEGVMHSGPDILRVLQAQKDVLRRRFSAQRIGLFGSCARGVSRPDSDIDILVELGEPTFDHYMDLKFYLEDLLGAPVDLVLADCVKPRLQPIIAQEVVYA
jgi:hypothetical protein